MEGTFSICTVMTQFINALRSTEESNELSPDDESFSVNCSKKKKYFQVRFTSHVHRDYFQSLNSVCEEYIAHNIQMVFILAL